VYIKFMGKVLKLRWQNNFLYYNIGKKEHFYGNYNATVENSAQQDFW